MADINYCEYTFYVLIIALVVVFLYLLFTPVHKHHVHIHVPVAQGTTTVTTPGLPAAETFAEYLGPTNIARPQGPSGTFINPNLAQQTYLNQVYNSLSPEQYAKLTASCNGPNVAACMAQNIGAYGG